MSVILKTLKASSGKIVADDNNEVSDVYTDLINTTSTSTGTGLTIIDDDGAYFIPNDLKDRQAIIDNVGSVVDKLGETLDVMANISTLNVVVGSPVEFTPIWIQSINNLKDSLDDLTASLDNIKKELV